MRVKRIIEPARFLDAFQKVGWKCELSSSKRFYLPTDPKDDSIWTRLPLDVNDPNYYNYQQKSVLFLLYALDLPETDESALEVISQLEAYNYKLISRIIGKNADEIDKVPYELATVVTEKNVEAFRYFALMRRKRKHIVPVDRLELNHTEVGSFVIPISLVAVEENNATLIPKQNDLGVALHEYLKVIENLVEVPRSSADIFAKRAFEESIDSKIVKNFLSKDGGIAKSSEKYKDRIEGVSIGGRNSPFLDYGLDAAAKSFKEVKLVDVSPVEDEYIKTLEDLEIKSDDSKIDEAHAKIDVIVDAIDRNGKARFTVTVINGEELKKGFKALSTELSMTKLQECAARFTKDGHFTIQGDIKKSKGRLGKIIVDSFDETDDLQATIFEHQ